tara:strand:- start:201 stop:365 length:165 start_codon:yes stop_codon:yes gene_type:complete
MQADWPDMTGRSVPLGNTTVAAAHRSQKELARGRNLLILAAQLLRFATSQRAKT